MLAQALGRFALLHWAVKSLTLVSLVLSLVNIDKCIDSNSEPEKCYPTKSTIHLAHLVKGELLLPEKIRATTVWIAPHPHHQ